LAASTADKSVGLVLEHIDKIIGLGFFQGEVHLFFGRVLLPKQEIFPDGGGKKDGLLGDVADMASQPLETQIFEVEAIQIDGPFVRVIKSHDQLEYG
jgi:hypothetical protein